MSIRFIEELRTATDVMVLAQSAIGEISVATDRPGFDLDPNDSAVICVSGDIVIGLATIRWWADWSTAFIGVAWVRPGNRREGVYRQIFQMVEQVARRKGMKKVACGVALCNDASLMTHEAFEMKRVAVWFEKEVSA